MLRSLQIQNYALINELNIDFDGGLTTITGETGAGKSILIGALSLILGERADNRILKDKEKKCLVEGILNHSDEIVNNILEENDIEAEDQLILRREVNPNGKSRAFINDTPVSLQTLREITIRLVDIHSQHENLELNNHHYQLMVIDAYAGLNEELKEYKEHFRIYKQIAAELNALKENAAGTQSELDYMQFQFNEISSARLDPDELSGLEKEAEILRHAEEIKLALLTTANTLSGNDQNALSLLLSGKSELERIQQFHSPSAILLNRIESVLIELKDIYAETDSLGERIEVDPSRLGLVEERISLIYSLLQKYRLSTVEELIGFRNDLEKKIAGLSNMEFRIDEMEKILKEKQEEIIKRAESLSAKRCNSFLQVENKIVELLVQLGMPNARFEIKNIRLNEPGENGFDSIRFLFTANKKTELRDICNIASGGELSRVMLSIKYIISGSTGLPSIVFDEIDAGVSGETAYRVGSIMKEMAESRQVFAITHLPQVAAFGIAHYLVYKNDSDTGTTTEIRLLSPEERINELAKMLSGKQTTGAAYQNAKELLRMAEKNDSKESHVR